VHVVAANSVRQAPLRILVWNVKLRAREYSSLSVIAQPVVAGLR